MDPYEANLRNTFVRVGAWLRGMVRRYRRPLLVVAAAGVSMAIGVSASDAPMPAMMTRTAPR
jgi:hypothetical protein